VTRVLATIGLVLTGVALPACFLPAGGGCPCGAGTSAPIGEHEPSFPGVHVVDEGVDCEDVPCRTE
jgi:hypothetical protein